MTLAREWGPIFKLTTPTGPRYIVYGLEMVDDLCDDSPLRQARRGQPAGAPQDPRERGPVHRGHRRPAVEVRARHPAAQLQHLGDEGLPRPDDRHRRAAVPEVGAPEPGRADRRHRGHDPPDPRHDRALRVQLPVQLVLPRHRAPLRRGDDGRAARDPGPAAPAPRSRSSCGAAPSGSCWPTRSSWTTRSARSSPSARRAATPGRTCSGTCSSARTSRGTACPTTTSSPSARRSWSPATRPPAACCRS